MAVPIFELLPQRPAYLAVASLLMHRYQWKSLAHRLALLHRTGIAVLAVLLLLLVPEVHLERVILAPRLLILFPTGQLLSTPALPAHQLHSASESIGCF